MKAELVISRAYLNSSFFFSVHNFPNTSDVSSSHSGTTTPSIILVMHHQIFAPKRKFYPTRVYWNRINMSFQCRKDTT